MLPYRLRDSSSNINMTFFPENDIVQHDNTNINFRLLWKLLSFKIDSKPQHINQLKCFRNLEIKNKENNKLIAIEFLLTSSYVFKRLTAVWRQEITIGAIYLQSYFISLSITNTFILPNMVKSDTTNCRISKNVKGRLHSIDGGDGSLPLGKN